jgi:lysozyme
MEPEKWVDVSFWQGKIDWPALAADAQGVCIKAGEANFFDRKFGEYTKAALAVGLPIHFYWFYRPYITGKKQADLFAEMIKGIPAAKPPVIDAEVMMDASPANVASSIRSFAENMVINTGGQVPWIYTGAGFVKSLLAGCWLPRTREARLGWARHYPLWLAMYPWERLKTFVRDYSYFESLAMNPASKPAAPWPWTDLAAWQFTGHGRVDGITTDCDVNIHYR